MSPTEPTSLQYQRLLDFLNEDLSDLPAEETAGLDRDAILAAARERAGKLRFARAKTELEQAKAAPQPSVELSPEVQARAREILAAIVREQPAFREKFSLAFRHGKDLPDADVLAILAELQALGLDLSQIARKLG